MEKLLIAKVIKMQGLIGEVKVKSLSNITLFKKGLKILLNDNSVLTLNTAREREGFLFLTFDGLTKIEQVEYLKNQELFIEENSLQELKNNEYYVKDLIGLNVITDSGKKLGKLEEIENYGANDVCFVRENAKETVFAIINGLLLNVDLEKKIITISEKILREVIV